ncbi:MAG: hypothetical protein AAF802_20905 [Planctomycetota bacterium]
MLASNTDLRLLLRAVEFERFFKAKTDRFLAHPFDLTTLIDDFGFADFGFAEFGFAVRSNKPNDKQRVSAQFGSGIGRSDMRF